MRAFPSSNLAIPLLLALTLAASSPGVSARDYTSNLTHTFTVKPGGKLVVDADYGAISLTPGDQSDVQVEVRRTVSGASQARADEMFAGHEVNFTQDGDRVEVRARMAKEIRRWFNLGRENFRVEFVVSLPKQFNLDLRTAAGSIACDDLQGSVKARTSGGSLKFAAVKGAFEGSTSAGSIRLGDISGKLAATTSGGSIHVDLAESDAALTTSAGSITVKAAKAKMEAHTSGGGIDLGEMEGPVDAGTSAGSINVKSAGAPLSLGTSGGGISIGEARETVVASTSAGSIRVTFAAQPTADSRLTAAGGSITVKLNPELSFDLDARANGGRITTELPVASTVLGEHRTSSLSGKIGAGGKALVLKTSAGGIRILKQ